jgi:hypothetical protein
MKIKLSEKEMNVFVFLPIPRISISRCLSSVILSNSSFSSISKGFIVSPRVSIDGIGKFGF